jgi:uncharacterized protein
VSEAPTAASALPWRETPDGVELAVRLMPRGGVARVERVAEWDGRPVLKVRVAAPPVEGAANHALVAFLARALAVPRSAITLVAGDRTRVKRLRIASPHAAARLAVLAEAHGTGSHAGRNRAGSRD